MKIKRSMFVRWGEKVTNSLRNVCENNNEVSAPGKNGITERMNFMVLYSSLSNNRWGSHFVWLLYRKRVPNTDTHKAYWMRTLVYWFSPLSISSLLNTSIFLIGSLDPPNNFFIFSPFATYLPLTWLTTNHLTLTDVAPIPHNNLSLMMMASLFVALRSRRMLMVRRHLLGSLAQNLQWIKTRHCKATKIF